MANGNGYISVGLSAGRGYRVDCHVYDDGGPILSIDGYGVYLAVSSDRRKNITEDDVRFARMLSEAVATYCAEVERWYEPNTESDDMRCPVCGTAMDENGRCPGWPEYGEAMGVDSHATA